MNDTNMAIKKAPSAIQATFGFALVALGAVLMMNAQSMAAVWNPLVIWLMICLIGALYLIQGIPSFIEGVMTMNAEYEERKRLLQATPPKK